MKYIFPIMSPVGKTQNSDSDLSAYLFNALCYISDYDSLHDYLSRRLPQYEFQ